jgi:RecA/RadA recombinase
MAFTKAPPPPVEVVVPIQEGSKGSGNIGKLAALRNTINGKVGAHAVKRVGSYGQIKRISTGIFQVDQAVGVNLDGTAGLPVGSPTILIGNESSGKTTTALRVAGNGQKLCSRCYRPAKNVKEVQATEEDGSLMLQDGEPIWILTGFCDCYATGHWKPVVPLGLTAEKKKEFQADLEALKDNSYRAFQAVFIDAEDSFDPLWASRFCYPRCMEIVHPGSAEEAIDITNQYIGSGLVDLVIFDSLAEATPEVEIAESAEKQQQGVHARLLNKFTRKSTALAMIAGTNGRPVTQIWIQQWREKIGMVFGDPRVMPGGKGQRYAANCIIELSASGFEEEPDPRYKGVLSEDDCPTIKISCTVSVKVLKNKSAAPHQTARYVLRLIDYGEWKAGDIDNFDQLIRMLRSTKINLLEEVKTSCWRIYIPQGNVPYVETKTAGDAKIWIEQNQELVELHLKKALAAWRLNPDEMNKRVGK